MINIIPITIRERGDYETPVSILAMQNENISKTLHITLPTSVLDKWIFIEFEKPNGKKYVSSRLEVVDRYVDYDLTAPLLDEIGELKIEVTARDGNDLVWKSSIIKFKILEAINATDEVEGEFTDIVADALRTIDLLKAKMDNGVIIEQNKKEDFRIWVGTQAEYDVLPTREKSDLFAIITDDKFKEDILEALANYEARIVALEGGSASGSTTTIPVIEVSGANVTIEPNKHYVISGITNSLTINMSEPITTELKEYSFEFSTIDRIPTVTIGGADMPLEQEFAKHTKYLCKIVNNNLVVLGVYDGYLYKFVYGLYSSADYTTSYNLKSDKTFVEAISGAAKNGEYQVEQSGNTYLITLTYEDNTVKIFTYSNGTITNNGVVYTKLS